MVQAARVFSRVATNEWDAVIVPHSQFDMLPISPEREAKTVNAQMREMKDLLRSAKARTNQTLDQVITEALRLITQQDAKAWLGLTLNRVQLYE